MRTISASAPLLLLLFGGCGLLVELPEAKLNEETASVTGGSSHSGDGDGDGDGDGWAGERPGSGSGPGDGGTKGDGDSSGGETSLGGALHSGGGAESGGAESGGAESGGAEGEGTGGSSDGCEKPCDCDNDGALRNDAACGGNDCDDEDARVFPGQTQFFAKASGNDAIGFDYNCDGEIQYPSGQEESLDCTKILLGSCSSGQGYKQLPACGNVADWGKCIDGLVNCEWSVLQEDKVATCH